MNVRGESSGDVRSLPEGDPEELARSAVGRAYERPLVELDGDPDALWSVDVSALIGHRITLGDHATPVPQIQDSLF